MNITPEELKALKEALNPNKPHIQEDINNENDESYEEDYITSEEIESENDE